MEETPDDYVKITITVDRGILERCRKRLDNMGMSDSWFVGICMEDYARGHFRIIDGEVEDIRKVSRENNKLSS